MTFDEWPEKHAKIFGLLSEQEGDMVAEWALLLEVSGYNAIECWEASKWLAAHEPPRFRSDHYPSLVRRIGIVRRQQSDAELDRQTAEANDDKGGICVNCFGVGYALVPHPKSVHGGLWIHPHYEMVVLCNCRLGRLIQSQESIRVERRNQDKDRRIDVKPRMDLGQYRITNPDWMIQMTNRTEEREREQAATGRAGDLDKVMGEIINRAKGGS